MSVALGQTADDMRHDRHKTWWDDVVRCEEVVNDVSVIESSISDSVPLQQPFFVSGPRYPQPAVPSTITLLNKEVKNYLFRKLQFYFHIHVVFTFIVDASD